MWFYGGMEGPVFGFKIEAVARSSKIAEDYR